MLADDKKFVHVVNFYLKPGLNEEEIKKFEAGVSSLGTIKEVVVFNVGKPAPTNRPVIDRSYHYCLLCVFHNMADHDIYQEHPTHLRFIEACEQYWEKVIIFDSETI